MFVRHWDSWAEPGTRSSLFGFAIAGGKLVGQGQRLTGGLIGDTPSKPFGGGEELNFSPKVFGWIGRWLGTGQPAAQAQSVAPMAPATRAKGERG